MFTGLIEDCGTLKSVVRTSTSAVITLNTALPTESLMKGDSVAVNGVCLTVVEKGAHSFSADVSPETFSRSTLELLRSGSRVNLERLSNSATPSLAFGWCSTVTTLSDSSRGCRATISYWAES